MSTESLVEEKKKKNAAMERFLETANVIPDSTKICNRCKDEVDESSDVLSVRCLLCKHKFHASGCFEEYSKDIAPPSVFKNTLQHAVNNTGRYQNRCGRFVFLCDFCMTSFENQQTVTHDEKVDMLDRKVQNMGNDLSEMKELLVKLTERQVSSPIVCPASTDMSVSANPWSNKERSDNMRQLLVIKKDNNGKTIDQNLLIKTGVDNQVQIIKTFRTSKQDTAVVLNSAHSAKLLEDKLKSHSPDLIFQKVPNRTPTINVVGIPKHMTKDEILHNILQLNEPVKTFYEGPTDEGQNKFNILALSELKNNKELNKATISVSNAIRFAISKRVDRLFVGPQSCKVYDSFYVKRCFKCQKYGHVYEDCRSDQICGHCCSGDHQTRDCPTKNNPTDACCTNCKNSRDSGLSQNYNHPTYSMSCPSYLAEQQKLKRSIPFYQRI